MHFQLGVDAHDARPLIGVCILHGGRCDNVRRAAGRIVVTGD
jgi:hypothetical protein